MDNLDLTHLSEMGILFVFFGWLFSQIIFRILDRKKLNNAVNGSGKMILEELKTINRNHLGSLENCIEANQRNLIETIHNDNTKIIELLSRIDGKISR